MKKIFAMLLVFTMLFSLAACDTDSQEDGNGFVKKNLLTVEVNVPAGFFTGVGTDGTELSESQKESGFKSVKINDDGSATYTIGKSDWNRLVEEMRTNIKTTLDELLLGDSFPSIKGIDYNDDFTAVTLIVDREMFESGFDSLAYMGIFPTVAYFQIFSGAGEPKLEISLKDEATGEIFETNSFPETSDTE